jgi:hypothetical protein
MALLRRYGKIPAVILAVCMIAPILAVAQVAWVKSYDAALKQAAREKKFIVLDISASW